MSARSRGVSRRHFVQGLCVLIGGTRASAVLSADKALSTAMEYEPDTSGERLVGQLFSRREMAILRVVCDVVMPQTDTPSATEVDVHGFVDNQLKHCYSEADQGTAVGVLRRLDEEASVRGETPFTQIQPDQQLAMLQDLEATRNGFSHQDREHFKALKELLVFGYYTSEAGATRALRYDPYPGGFRGKVSLGRDDRTWFRNR